MATFNYEFEDVSEKISIESDEIIDEKLNPITNLYIFDLYLAGNGFIANLQYDDLQKEKTLLTMKIKKYKNKISNLELIKMKDTIIKNNKIFEEEKINKLIELKVLLKPKQSSVFY